MTMRKPLQRKIIDHEYIVHQESNLDESTLVNKEILNIIKMGNIVMLGYRAALEKKIVVEVN